MTAFSALRMLAREIAPLVGADPDLAERAAILAKADLVSGMVGEFPELQGVMGRYYALDQEEDPVVADAIAAHYKPVGPSDDVPRDPVAIAVALADKLDMLVGFWAIDEKPTGSKDPYALRRAALGVIRIVLENSLRIPAMQVALTALLHATGHLATRNFWPCVKRLFQKLPGSRSMHEGFARLLRPGKRSTGNRTSPHNEIRQFWRVYDLGTRSSPTGSRCISARRARGTIWLTRCSRSAATTC